MNLVYSIIRLNTWAKISLNRFILCLLVLYKIQFKTWLLNVYKVHKTFAVCHYSII